MPITTHNGIDRGSKRMHPRAESFIGLVGGLRTDVRTLIRKEVELARTEMAEKVKLLVRNAGMAAAGAGLGAVALFLLTLGLGALGAFLFRLAGLNAGLSYFLSFSGMALILGGIAFILVERSLHQISHLTLAPQKTIETIRGPEPVHAHDAHQQNGRKPGSDEIRGELAATRARMDTEVSEIKDRLSPIYIAKSSLSGMRRYPLRSLGLGAAAGLSGYLIWRQRRKAEIARLKASHPWWPFRSGRT